MDVSKEKEAREQEKKKKGGYDMRLIDADALMRVIDAVPLTFDGGVDINELETVINEQPTIEERKTGEWINVTNDESLEEEYECSVCGYELFYSNPTKFCPNCGARMRGERNDNN